MEDPNEAFTNIRDACDLRFLMDCQDEEVKRLCSSILSTPKDNEGNLLIDRQSLVKLTKEKYKINKKQAEKCYEMLLLKGYSNKVNKRYHPYRVQVKRRLYRQNVVGYVCLRNQSGNRKCWEKWKKSKERPNWMKSLSIY